MRTILKYLIPIALGIGVFLTAKYLDVNPRTDVPETQPQQTQVWQEPAETTAATEPDATEETAPEAMETEPADTAAQEAVAEQTIPAETEPEQQRCVLTFVGDCTLGGDNGTVKADTGFFSVIGEDYQYPFRNVVQWFEEDDLTLINLEGALTNSGYARGKDVSFRGPEEYVKILTENSVEFVSVSNDRVMDYGTTGYRATCRTLKNAELSYVERNNSSMITLENGLKVGVYGVVYYDIDTDAVCKGIAELRSAGADIVIFAPHWGYERSYAPRAEEMQLAHAAIDAGADIVYGTHPHVLQPVETYKDGIIFYSLGSFCNGGNLYPKDFDTALIQLELDIGEDGSVKLGQWSAVPCSLSSAADWNSFQPTPYEEGSEGYRRVLSKLDGSWKVPYVNGNT